MADGWNVLNNVANIGKGAARAVGRAGAAVGNDLLERGAQRIQNARGIQTEAQYRAWLEDAGISQYRDWKGIKVIGRGGQGKAGLWVRLDEHLNIVDRIVMKETLPSDFDDPYYWGWPGIRYKFTRDVAVHTIVGPDEGLIARLRQQHYLKLDQPIHHNGTPAPQSSNTPIATPRKIGEGSGIVHLRQNQVDVRNKKLRMYMDYASQGDLFQLLDRQASVQRVPVRHDDGTMGETIHRSSPVPEQYCWFVMYHLMLACKAMEHVKFGKEGEVIHQDIKFGNIFLDAPNPDWFPNYPIPKLGDFGSARMTFPGDPQNPMDWHDGMTDGWIPPEYTSDPWVSYTRAANVYQCGLAILGLMQCNQPDHNPKMRNVRLSRLQDNYSQELVRIVSSLLTLRPEDRARPRMVLGWLDRNSDRIFGGVDKPDTALLRPELLVKTGLDNYKLGMRYRDPDDVEDATSGMTDSGELVDFSDRMSGVVMGK